MASAQQAKNIIDANILDTFTLFIHKYLKYLCSMYLPLSSILGRMDMEYIICSLCQLIWLKNFGFIVLQYLLQPSNLGSILPRNSIVVDL